MKERKMIVVDLDGTLLNINSRCTRNTKKYLSKLKDAGYIIVINTGRVLKSAIDITDGAEFANYIIASAGALIYDMDNKKIIYKKSISKIDTKRIIDIYNKDIDYINLCDLYYHNRYMGNNSINIWSDKQINNINNFLSNSDDIYHITVKLKDNSLVNKYYNKLKNDSLNIIVMQDSFTNRKWLEIFNKDVSKYKVISILSKINHISNENIIAFGDGLNDIDMISMCGVGVAMFNALKEVKDVSNYITLSHNEDGVIYFLKKYLKEDNLRN